MDTIKCKKCRGTGSNRAGACNACKGSGAVNVKINPDGSKTITPAVRQ